MVASFVLPSATAVVRARAALVLAPHADDELLGCGGLLAQLAASGTRVRVLYLTDSSGGLEVTSGQEAYAERRRAEAARGLERLGIAPGTTLAIPDGRLAEHLPQAVAAITAALSELAPDLVLSVSPLETTADHRAAFAALHAALTPLRAASALGDALATARILLYEINHPAYPDLLVDVSAELEAITAAVAEHASQLELHDYLAAGLGLRRYRTLSLGPTVKAAEGYRQLGLADFTTHSLSSLTRAVGGPERPEVVADGPLVSVVVRTKDRPALLAEALASLAASSYRRLEVVLVNDGGTPPTVADGFPFPLRSVELSPGRGRAAAANAGIAAARGEWVSFLDDDDRVLPEHVATLVGLTRAAGVRVAYTDAAVVVLRLDGEHGWVEHERRLPYSRDFDPELLLLDNYIPFHTAIFERRLLAEVGALDETLPFFEDWELLLRLARLTPFHHLARVTCEYRQYRGAGHHVLGDTTGGGTDFLATKARVIERHRHHLRPEALARVVASLRAEAVAHGEAAHAARAEASGHRQRYFDLEAAYHRLNGEAVGLRQERADLLALRAGLEQERQELGERLAALDQARTDLRSEVDGRGAEIERLGRDLQQRFDAERDLRAVVADQDGHLHRLYAEIARLQGVITAMEGTAAWRWRRRLRRLLGRA